MTSFIDPKTLKTWLHDGAEIALLDVREHGQYGEAHLFYGIPLPFSRLELDAPRLAWRSWAIRMCMSCEKARAGGQRRDLSCSRA